MDKEAAVPARRPREDRPTSLRLSPQDEADLTAIASYLELSRADTLRLSYRVLRVLIRPEVSGTLARLLLEHLIATYQGTEPPPA